MARKNSENATVSGEALDSLRERAQAGDAGAAMELFNSTKTRKNPDYKYDPRTPVATDSVTGDTFGVVTWHPADSDTKYHYPIRISAETGAIEIVHNSNGKPVTLDQASEMKTFISAMKMAGIIRD